jgi:hypothetical protein
MSATAGEQADDPLQQALKEADALMNDLHVSSSAQTPPAPSPQLPVASEDDDDAVVTSSLSKEVIGGFSIDEEDDDDGEMVEEILHPLHDTFLLTVPPPSNCAVSNDPFEGGTAASASSVQSTPQRTPPPFSGGVGAFPLPVGSSTTTTPTIAFASSSLAQLQQPPPVATAAGGTSATANATAAAQIHDTMDAFKSTTSKFASNLAVFAQRAATTVAAQGAAAAMSLNAGGGSGTAASMTSPVTLMGGGPAMTMYGTGGGASVIPSSSSAAATTTVSGNSLLMPGAVTHTAMISPAVARAQHALAALDKDQKQALLERHVGTLLPGESVIMFLTNLLFVEAYDSSFRNLASSPSNSIVTGGGQALWCCVMTFYRLVLFATATAAEKGDENKEAGLSLTDVAATAAASAPRDDASNIAETTARPFDLNAACLPPRSTGSSYIEIPLASIDRVEKSVFASPALSSTTTVQAGLRIQSKLGQVVRFSTLHFPDTAKAQEALNTYAFPGRRNLGYLFAFESKRQAVMDSIVTDPDSGKKTVTLAATASRFIGIVEYARQLQDNSAWKIYTRVNAGYQVCSSYPSVVVGPATIAMDDTPEGRTTTAQCAAFRSEGRWPCLTWGSASTGASLWRASQPKVGLQGNRNPHDEWYLRQIMECAAGQSASAAATSTQQPPPAAFLGLIQYLTGSTDLAAWMRPGSMDISVPGSSSSAPQLRPVLKILDLRPKSSAMANRTGGYGYEIANNYPGTTIQFCGIGNIHAVRDSYNKLLSVTTSPRASDLQWNATIEDTKWLSHVRLILAASWECAFWIHVHQLPVLLHCSHGWDRTGQVAALAQLLLDPFYRTRRGFAVVVEKDFMAFGHPFHTRCSHGEGKGISDSTSPSGVSNSSGSNDDGQVSPIFLQFLDCVYQIVSLYPECFEFSTKYLLVLSEHIYSCRFGNFLCDTEREREQMAGIRQRTHCLWEFLERRVDLVNPTFTDRAGGGVLLMPLPTLLRHVHLWSDRHCRYSPKATSRWLPSGMSYSDGRYPTAQELQRLVNAVDSCVVAPGTQASNESRY